MSNDENLLGELGNALDRPVPAPSAERIAAVRAAALREQNAPRSTDAAVRGITTRRALLLSTAAAAMGAVGGAVVANANQDEPTTAPGPPTEALAFSPSAGSIAGSEVSGKVINHTWGVELLLDATGFPVGTAYRVVYIDTADGAIEAGGFVGAELPIHCRLNAALLRDDIAAIEIRDGADAPISRADFI